MKVEKTIIKQVQEVDKIVCDKCNTDCDVYCVARLIYAPRYGSEFDEDWWEVDLCEECWKKMMFDIIGEMPEPGKVSRYRC